MTLIFATNNQHKIDEVQAIIGTDFELLTLQQAGIDIDIPEPHDTPISIPLQISQKLFNIPIK